MHEKTYTNTNPYELINSIHQVGKYILYVMNNVSLINTDDIEGTNITTSIYKYDIQNKYIDKLDIDYGTPTSKMLGNDLVINTNSDSYIDKFMVIDVVNLKIKGFINILESCKASNINKLFYASSSSVYGDSNDSTFLESATRNPVSLYGFRYCFCIFYCTSCAI